MRIIFKNIKYCFFQLYLKIYINLPDFCIMAFYSENGLAFTCSIKTVNVTRKYVYKRKISNNEIFQVQQSSHQHTNRGERWLIKA